ncbi:MAG TPA: prepilin-type N-terminal cleavage/methylation domain-containing protein [Acidimicrobiales bacterium]|jgi:type IV pilus assembly protein PilA|nr:prepilin-type N-terminal cleavage/methylation domain-containing protein [Acidimicrobiales bacterium]
MLTALRKRHEREDEGFTLIELMVVVLIIAILLAIAIPTFLGARERAQEREAQSNLRNGYSAAKTVYVDTQKWGTLDMTAVSDAEPSLSFGTAVDATNPKVIDVERSAATSATDDWIIMAVQSKNSKCFAISEIVLNGSGSFGAVENPDGTTTAGSQTKGTYYAKWDVADGACAAVSVPPAGDGWQTKW